MSKILVVDDSPLDRQIIGGLLEKHGYEELFYADEGHGLYIQKDRAAGALRAKLTKRLEQFAADGDKLGREVVELQTRRMEIRIALEDTLQSLDMTAPPPKK